jgi:hypothetical protein
MSFSKRVAIVSEGLPSFQHLLSYPYSGRIHAPPCRSRDEGDKESFKQEREVPLFAPAYSHSLCQVLLRTTSPTYAGRHLGVEGKKRR